MKKLKLTFLLAMNLYPKLIVTVLIKGLTQALFLQRAKALHKGVADHIAYVPGILPIPADFLLEVNKLEGFVNNADSLLAQMKANTENIKKQEKVVADTLTDKWAKTIETATGMTADKVKEMGFGVKNVDDQQAEPKASVTNSHPMVSEIEYGYLTHTFHIRNSMTGKYALPDDAYYIEVYEQIGGDEPTDWRKMIPVGRVVRGKYTNHFDPSQKGSVVWYIFVYVPKKAGIEIENTGSVKYNIV
jgi:hypothetical protein